MTRNVRGDLPQMSRVALATLLAFAAGVSAAEPSYKFSGFGTLGYTRADTDGAEFLRAGSKDGADKSGTLKVDSRLGSQINATFSPMFSAVGQVIAQQNHEGKFKPDLEWAFVKAQATPAIGVRAGRIGVPFFMVSDFREVGFANTFLRPPHDVYDQVVFRRMDGADLLGNFELGGVNLSGQIFYGKSSTKFAASTGTLDIDLNKLWGLNATAEFGPVSVRVGHAAAKLTSTNATIAGLFAGLRQAGALVPGLTQLANDLEAIDKDASFSGIGLSLDHNDFIGQAEYTKRSTDSYIADSTGWYVMGGYRIGSFTPYLIVSEYQQNSAGSTNAIPPLPSLAQLANGLNGTLLLPGDQETLALGVRWDFRPGFALKAQWDQIKPSSRIGNAFGNATPGYNANGKTIDVMSVAVDFVF
jgi:Gram-negative porin